MSLIKHFEHFEDPIGSNEINSIGSSEINPILYIKFNCISKLSDYYPMLREKYGDEELSTIIREEDLSIMRKKFDSYLSAKNRFAALKGTVLESIPPVDSTASRASEQSLSITVESTMPIKSMKNTTTVIYSGQTVKESQVNQSSSAITARLTPFASATTIITSTSTCTSGCNNNVTTMRRADERSSSSTDSFYHTYDALIQGREWPAGVDPAKREQYLSPDDFFKIFKMSKSAFSTLDQHKKIRIKKEVRLF